VAYTSGACFIPSFCRAQTQAKAQAKHNQKAFRIQKHFFRSGLFNPRLSSSSGEDDGAFSCVYAS